MESPQILEKFKESVQTGDAAQLRNLLATYPEARTHLDSPFFSFDSPAIREAVSQKNRELIDVLLEAGADINKRSEWAPGGFGVLDLVEAELGEYLISRGATVTIHAAANLDKLDRLETLLQQDPSLVNARGGDGATPLHFASSLETVNTLLRHGADVTIRDLDHNSTAAMWQIQNRDNLYCLLEAGSEPDIFMACRHGDIALAKLVLMKEPDALDAVIGVGDYQKETKGNIYIWTLIGGGLPLPIASHFGNTDLVDYLLGVATPSQRLIHHCISGEETGARAVLQENPDLLKTLRPDELNAFPNAVWNGFEGAVRVFCAVGFPPTGRGQDGGTALHVAAWKGNADMVRMLLPLGFDLEDANDAHGSTPLGWACHGARFCGRKNGDYLGVVDALLAAGADANKPANKYGASFFDWATPEMAERMRNKI